MNYVRVCGFHIIVKDIPTARLRRILKLEGVLMQISRSVGRLRMFNILRVTTPGYGSLSSLPSKSH